MLYVNIDNSSDMDRITVGNVLLFIERLIDFMVVLVVNVVNCFYCC